MRAISDFVVHVSRSWPLFALAAILGPATLAFVLFPIMEAFTALSGGFAPFDWQPDLDRAAIAAQLPGYTPAMRSLYLAHSAVDVVFPVFMGAFLGAIGAACLRTGLPGAFAGCEALGLFSLFLVAAPLDLAENIGAAGLIWLPGAGAEIWTAILLGAKQGKLVAQQLVPLAAVATAVLGLGGWVWRRVAR
jgi:hypothetical protein